MKVLSPAKLAIIAFTIATFFASAQVKTGAGQTEKYLDLLRDKNVGLTANHTSRINDVHLLDSLLAEGIMVKKIFSPEHGFRGDQGAGKKIRNNIDPKTRIPIISLYGNHKKPASKDLKGLDIMVFDIQDVGCRFYTYISTLHYVMEACAENDLPLLVLDRPNPNGFYIDGPVLEKEYASFVGMHPVPIVYGMTIGEYARMINGEKWLNNNLSCELKVIPLKNYTHDTLFELPVSPSPNLPTREAVYLYPSLALFEGTVVSVGRGTQQPFEVIGFPGFSQGNYTFTPQSIPGKAANPPYQGRQCRGFLLTNFAREYILNSSELYLYWLTGFYKFYDGEKDFFTPFFDKLAGTDQLRKKIIRGWSVDKIKASWQDDLNVFKTTRKKYLLYKDFKK